MLKVTATQLPRLLTCNGSRLMAHLPSSDENNPVRDEGNAADWLIQQVVTGQFLLEELVDRKAPNGVYITSDMVEHLQEYLSVVLGYGEIERDCSHQHNDWLISGRADNVYNDLHTLKLHIRDFKYGWRIVEPENNWTLISHAIGYIEQTGAAPREISFEIYQPRPYHPKGTVRRWVITSEELWHNYRAKIHETLGNLTDNLVTSDHCYKCPSMAICPAAQISSMNAVDISLRAYESDPDNDSLEFLIEQTKQAEKRLETIRKAYEDMALSKLKNGSVFKNYAVAADLGREVFRDDITPEFIEMMTGVDISIRKLPTPKQAISAGLNEDFVKNLTTRPSKGVKLVRRNANDIAKELFNRK